MRMLAPRYRRIAALGILFVVLALPVAAAVSVFEICQSNRVEMEERRAAISRFEAIARYAPELEAQRVRSPEASHAAWFLPGSDPAIAAASLQARLKQLAQNLGIDVAQAHDLKPRAGEGISYVGIGLEMSGSADGVAGFLAALESNLPLLVVQRADIRAETSGIDPRYDPVVLYVDLDVWGALAGPAIVEKQKDDAS
jgi:Type II secretion system (T2SS), protein M subtype b